MRLDAPKSRRDIRSTIAKHETDMAKGLEGGDRISNDKAIEERLAESLHLKGSHEGNEAVKKAVESAGHVTDQEHEAKGSELQKEVFDEAKKTEQELEERSNSAATDAEDARKASAQVDTASARGQLEAAEGAAKEDAEHVLKEKEAQERGRKKGETDFQKQRQKVQGAKIKFRP